MHISVIKKKNSFIRKKLTDKNIKSLKTCINRFISEKKDTDALLKKADRFDLLILSQYYLLMGQVFLIVSEKKRFSDRVNFQKKAQECYQKIKDIIDGIPPHSFFNGLAELQLEIDYNLHKMPLEHAKALLSNPDATPALIAKAQKEIRAFENILDKTYKDKKVRSQLGITDNLLKMIKETRDELQSYQEKIKTPKKAATVRHIDSDLECSPAPNSSPISLLNKRSPQQAVLSDMPETKKHCALTQREFPQPQPQLKKISPYKMRLIPLLAFFGHSEASFSPQQQIAAFKFALSAIFKDQKDSYLLGRILQISKNYLAKMNKREGVTYINTTQHNTAQNLSIFITKMEQICSRMVEIDSQKLEPFIRFLSTSIIQNKLFGESSEERGDLLFQLYTNNIDTQFQELAQPCLS